MSISLGSLNALRRIPDAKAHPLIHLFGSPTAPRAKSTSLAAIIRSLEGQDTTSSDAAMRIAAVYACVRVIAETLGSLPIILYKRQKDGRSKDRATDDGIYNLLRWRPNPFQTAFEFVEQLMWCVLLRGNAYVQIIRTGTKQEVTELLLLDPTAMTVTRGEFGLVYDYKPNNGKAAKFERKTATEPPKIMHVRGLSTDGLIGRSVLTDARDVFATAKSAQEFARRALENDATPSVVLTHPNTLDEEAAKRLRESWQELFSGARNAGKTAVLEEGMKVEKLSMSAADMQFLETRKFQRSEIAALFRVPLHMIGDLERATFSNIEQQSIEFVMHTIRPWAVRIEQAIQAAILSDSTQQASTYFVEVLLSALMRGDLKSRYDAYMVARQGGWLSINDVRELENMNPIPNGNDYLQPLNMAPVGTKPTATGEPTK